VKCLPIVALAAFVSVQAAAQPGPVQPVGRSNHPPRQVAQCIAKTWADRSQKQVLIQYVAANDRGFAVLLPGQTPGGAAALVDSDGGPGTRVAFRTAGRPYREAVADIQGCL